jgi:hypothetical protein
VIGSIGFSNARVGCYSEGDFFELIPVMAELKSRVNIVGPYS